MPMIITRVSTQTSTRRTQLLVTEYRKKLPSHAVAQGSLPRTRSLRFRACESFTASRGNDLETSLLERFAVSFVSISPFQRDRWSSVLLPIDYFVDLGVDALLLDFLTHCSLVKRACAACSGSSSAPAFASIAGSLIGSLSTSLYS